MILSKKELQQFFVLGWHFNHDNIVRLRDSHLLLCKKLVDLRDAVAWYFECKDSGSWSYGLYQNLPLKIAHIMHDELNKSIKHAEQQLREMIGGKDGD